MADRARSTSRAVLLTQWHFRPRSVATYPVPIGAKRPIENCANRSVSNGTVGDLTAVSRFANPGEITRAQAHVPDIDLPRMELS
jgi:hypothetical protein